MITVNDPNLRLNGGKEQEINAPMGVDFITDQGDKFNVRLERGELVVRKVSDNGNKMVVMPWATNVIVCK